MKPAHDRFVFLNTLIHSVVQTYYPEKIEQIDVHYQDLTETDNSFKLNKKDFQNNHSKVNTISNAQQCQKLAPRVFSPVPNSNDFDLMMTLMILSTFTSSKFSLRKKLLCYKS